MTVRVDWFRITAELQGKGYSLANISAAIDVPKSTILGWRSLDAEPRHADGERLIALWGQVLQLPREALPLNVEDLMSAARACRP